MTHHAQHLRGMRVVDFSSLGPGPFASMMLADFGAEVVSVQRVGMESQDLSSWLGRGKLFVGLNLNDDDDRAAAIELARGADIVLEGFRPGVMERLGLGPETLHRVNRRLVYARLTGWGQNGAYAARAGHDINFLAISGALAATGGDAPAMPPPALLGDLASGSLFVVCGILLALVERQRTGEGGVVDAAIVDGASYLLTALLAEKASGSWSGIRQEHLLSGSAPFYTLYRCRDGRWFTVGAIETKFYDAFLRVLGFDDVSRAPADQMNQSGWPALKARVAVRMAECDRQTWEKLFVEADACGAAVLDLDELADDVHLSRRRTVANERDKILVAAAPRISGILGAPSVASKTAGDPIFERLRGFGLPDQLLERILETASVIERTPSDGG